MGLCRKYTYRSRDSIKGRGDDGFLDPCMPVSTCSSSLRYLFSLRSRDTVARASSNETCSCMQQYSLAYTDHCLDATSLNPDSSSSFGVGGSKQNWARKPMAKAWLTGSCTLQASAESCHCYIPDTACNLQSEHVVDIPPPKILFVFRFKKLNKGSSDQDGFHLSSRRTNKYSTQAIYD